MTAIRPAATDELSALATLWHTAWHEAHADHVPPALLEARSFNNFLNRVVTYGDRLRVAGPNGAPLGFCVVDGAELDQLFVARHARGTGIAQDLMIDGERRIAAAGHPVAHLFCLPQNARAIRFYSRHGWLQKAIREVEVQTGGGPVPLEALVMEKHLRGV